MLWFIVLALVLDLAVIAGLYIYMDRPRGKSTMRAPLLRFRGGGNYGCMVVGVAAHRSALERIYGDDVQKWSGKKVLAILIPSEDGKTMRVELAGRTIGYLAGEPAKACYERLRQWGRPGAQGVCKATIVVRSRLSYANFDVRLDLPQGVARASPMKEVTIAQSSRS